MQRAYLVVVRREGDTWVVDEDSYHNLKDRGSDVLELKVRAIRSLAPTPEEGYEDENQDDDDQEAAATAQEEAQGSQGATPRQ